MDSQYVNISAVGFVLAAVSTAVYMMLAISGLTSTPQIEGTNNLRVDEKMHKVDEIEAVVNPTSSESFPAAKRGRQLIEKAPLGATAPKVDIDTLGVRLETFIINETLDKAAAILEGKNALNAMVPAYSDWSGKANTRGVKFATLIGKALNKVKGLVGHGKFKTWADTHLPIISERSRTRYMTVATPTDTEMYAGLGIDRIYILAIAMKKAKLTSINEFLTGAEINSDMAEDQDKFKAAIDQHIRSNKAKKASHLALAIRDIEDMADGTEPDEDEAPEENRGIAVTKESRGSVENFDILTDRMLGLIETIIDDKAKLALFTYDRLDDLIYKLGKLHESIKK